MTHLTLLLFVDAFRRDYLSRTTFMRSFAASSGVGAMREYFGFLPQAGYFGGLGPSDTGFTNMYCCDPVASPFGVARGLPNVRADRDDDRLGARAWVDAEAKSRMTPFAASYASSAAIPLSLLPAFDVVEKYAPWDRRIGYRSIFHELEDRDDAYFCCAWPETNHLEDHSDRAIVERVLRQVGPQHRLAYLHLQELDAIGHAYGPESSELIAGIDRTDLLVERLVGELRKRVDRLDTIMFSDHGMVSVTGTVDVWSAIEATGFVPGRDVVFFLDSTMARFWFPTNVARPAAVDALSSLPGRILDPRDLRRLDLHGCDPRNGELFFLAAPGHIIVPNFFQHSAHHTRGMHGYEPDCPDNMGIFLVNDPDRNRPVDLGVVGPTAVYHALRRTLGLARSDDDAEKHAEMSEAAEGDEFTQHRDSAARETILRHMRRVVDEARQIAASAEAVILSGSFGRNEGGVSRDANGRFVPVNDYDVVVLTPDTSAPVVEAFQSLGDRLAHEFGTDFVHFSVWPGIETAALPTLANYDLRYGSRVLWGDPDVLKRLPRMAAADIPDIDGLQLLYNRLGGILTGLQWPETSVDLTTGQRRYLFNQVMKARIALGDWRLLQARAYDVSYRKRQERFTWLAPGLSVDATERSAILSGYHYKLHPDEVAVTDVVGSAIETGNWLVTAIMRATSEMTRRVVDTPAEAAGLYRDILGVADDIVHRDNALATRLLCDDAVVRVKPDASTWVRSEIYASFPLVATAVNGDDTAFTRACERLDRCLSPPWPRELTPGNWETVRSRLSHAWLALMH